MKEYCPIFAGSTYRCQCKGHSLDAPVPQQDLFEIKVSCSTPHGILLKKMQSIVVCIYVDNSYYVGSGAESATRVTASKSILWPSSGRSKQYFHNTII